MDTLLEKRNALKNGEKPVNTNTKNTTNTTQEKPSSKTE